MAALLKNVVETWLKKCIKKMFVFSSNPRESYVVHLFIFDSVTFICVSSNQRVNGSVKIHQDMNAPLGKLTDSEQQCC